MIKTGIKTGFISLNICRLELLFGNVSIFTLRFCYFLNDDSVS